MAIYAVMISIPIWLYGMDNIIYRQYIGYGIRILTGCFIASYFRSDFVSKFENLVFVLAYMSIPLFVLQLIDIHIYDIFSPLSRAVMGANEYTSNGVEYFTQYFFIYYQHGTAINRNSGFMWEPGAYAMMLTWAMLFRLYISGYKFNHRLIVYFVAMLTTFSLMGYPSLMLLIIMFFAQRAEFKKIVYAFVGGGLLLLILLQTPLFLSQTNMMTRKAEFYREEAKVDMYRNSFVIEKNEKSVGRLAQFYILKDLFLDDPFGKGMSSVKYISPNAFITLIVRWGINAILILTISFYYFSKRLEQMAGINQHWYITLMAMAVLILPTISNPVYNRVIFLAIVVFPLFAKRQILK